MTQERIARLKAIGFKFATRKRRPRRDGTRVVLSEDEHDGKARDDDSSSEEDEREAKPQAVNDVGRRAAQGRFPWDRYHLHTTSLLR